MQTENWNERYQNTDIPWDMGQASPPLTGFLQNYTRPDHRILIPGAGSAYEAEWMWRNGFTNVTVAEVAAQPLQDLQKRIPDFPPSQLLHKDFFALQGRYDLILEQTFFCAIHPQEREHYAQKMKELLVPGGKLAGVFFDFPLSDEGPPFGGSCEEYAELFARYFKIYKLERCYNSIPPRAGSELFGHFIV